MVASVPRGLDAPGLITRRLPEGELGGLRVGIGVAGGRLGGGDREHGGGDGEEKMRDGARRRHARDGNRRRGEEESFECDSSAKEEVLKK